MTVNIAVGKMVPLRRKSKKPINNPVNLDVSACLGRADTVKSRPLHDLTRNIVFDFRGSAAHSPLPGQRAEFEWSSHQDCSCSLTTATTLEHKRFGESNVRDY